MNPTPILLGGMFGVLWWAFCLAYGIQMPSYPWFIGCVCVGLLAGILSGLLS